MQENQQNQDAAPASAEDNNLVPEPARPSEEIVPLQRMGRPLRRAPLGLMTLMAATAAIGGSLGLPMMRAAEKPHELTKHDHERLREAELKRQRRAAKKAENQRRANAGKRPNVRISDAPEESSR